MSRLTFPEPAEDEEHALAIAQTLLDEGRWEEARAVLQRLLELHPTSARSWNKLGVCLVKLGDRPGAEHAFRTACENDPRYPAPWSNLGNLYLEADALDRAEAAYRRALSLDPDFALAHHNLAALLKRTGRYDEAVRHLKRSVRLERDLAGGLRGSRRHGGWLVYLLLAALAFLAWLWRQGTRALAGWAALGAALVAWMPLSQACAAPAPPTYLAGWVTPDLASQPLAVQVERVAASLLSEPVTLRLGAWRTTVRPAELGIRPDLGAMRSEAEQRAAAGLEAAVPLRLSGPDPAALQRLVRRLDAALAVAPTEPRVMIDGPGRAHILPGRPGRRVDALALARGLQEASLAVRFRTLEIPMEPVAPRHDPAELEPVLGAPALLSSYTTRVESPEGDRALNVALAAAALNGALLTPGETFSFNRFVGPRITERGYREAPVLVDGRFEVGVGGGVCQVSSTLYNAALLAGLGARGRSPHSLPVWYVPLARDATVSYNAVDLQLHNPLPHPVAIRAVVDGDRLTVQVWGPGDGRVPPYRLRTVVEAAWKATVVTVEDVALEGGARVIEAPGNTGYESTLWRELPLYGPAVARERINRSSYPMRPAVVRVGRPGVRTESRISEATPAAGMALDPVKQEAHPAS